jgi:hypothetical protein
MTDRPTMLSASLSSAAYAGTQTRATQGPSITVEHLVKRYKKAESNAVDDISFTVGYNRC